MKNNFLLVIHSNIEFQTLLKEALSAHTPKIEMVSYFCLKDLVDLKDSGVIEKTGAIITDIHFLDGHGPMVFELLDKFRYNGTLHLVSSFYDEISIEMKILFRIHEVFKLGTPIKEVLPFLSAELVRSPDSETLFNIQLEDLLKCKHYPVDLYAKIGQELLKIFKKGDEVFMDRLVPYQKKGVKSFIAFKKELNYSDYLSKVPLSIKTLSLRKNDFLFPF